MNQERDDGAASPADLKQPSVAATDHEQRIRAAFDQAGDTLIGRMKANKATYKQAALLRKHGYSTDVSMSEATVIIDRLAKNGWRRPVCSVLS